MGRLQVAVLVLVDQDVNEVADGQHADVALAFAAPQWRRFDACGERERAISGGQLTVI